MAARVDESQKCDIDQAATNAKFDAGLAELNEATTVWIDSRLYDTE